MRSYNLLIKIFMAVLVLVIFWQISNLWKSATPEKSELEKLIEKQQIQPVVVTVFYEALCPDSRSFIKHQLKPTFDKIEDYIDVNLIPYGKAETIVTSDDYEFKCQHGETECEANMIHACAIHKVLNSRRRLELVECMISNNMHPQAILETCAKGMDELKDIVQCSKSMEGRKMLKRFGDLTKSLDPRVSFIPTITLDHEMDNQILILKNLLHQVCQRLDSPPSECKS
ncbi:hypothetical protein TSAR_012927 [Trichomalopsis sarcophagae]|uniref:Gamma-interferon-inducible lysosomal thiol reductase n=1 Tax=Trichomalopsis sarcophagae TaxID=543379 RepID=A0A232F3M8_9HYME|nr:hypothetical protein TSAR_012927 [Trichomalopsis sarcophagae]